MGNRAWALRTGLIFCLLQVVLALGLAPWPGTRPGESYLRVTPPAGWLDPSGEPFLKSLYLRLNNWDSVHFFDLASNGYRMPDGPVTREDVHAYRANVTFLPAYPLLVRWASQPFGLPLQIGMLLISQIFAVMFWGLYLLLLLRSGVERSQAWRAAAFVAAFPGAFYLVTGYTESFCLAALLAFILATDRWWESTRFQWGFWGLAAAAGFAMSASRLVVLPAVAYPIFRAMGDEWGNRAGLVAAFRSLTRRKNLGAIALSLAASLGAGSFFLYCQLRFGEWDLYFKLLRIGWEQENSLFAFLLDARSYFPRLFFEDTHVSLNRAAVPLSLGVLLLALRNDWRRGAACHRFGIYATALGLLYLAMAGKVNSQMDGMVRYGLPVFALGTAALFGSFAGETDGRSRIRWLWRLWPWAWVLLLAGQLYMARRFLIGHWVS